MRPETLSEHLQSAVTAVPDLRRAYCAGRDITSIRHGRSVRYRGTQDFDNGEMLAVLDEDGRLACLAQFDTGGGLLVPKQVFPV